MISILENFLTLTGCKATYPVTVIVSSSFVGKFTLAIIVVVFEASFVDISIILYTFALTIALSVNELAICNISIVVGHLSFAGHSSTNKGTFILHRAFACLVSINTLTMEFVELESTSVRVTL